MSTQDKMAQALRRIVSNLMHQRRFGVDDMGHWRRAATQAEGDLGEALAAHEAEKQAQPVAIQGPAVGAAERLTPDELEAVYADGYRSTDGELMRATETACAKKWGVCLPAAAPKGPAQNTAPPSPLAEQDKVDAELTDEEILRAISPEVWLHIEGERRAQALNDARAVIRAARAKKGEAC